MVIHATYAGIRAAMFDIDDNKASGPDGYSSPFFFFQKAWNVIGDDTCNAVRELFRYGKILKEAQFYCIALGIKNILNTSNILVELLKGYSIASGPKRCAMKIDVQKAYATVDCTFIEVILVKFGFHGNIVKSIKACVTSSSFSICINLDIKGGF
ncbi:uncharacterized protein [Rutidosis leptorrhynchoides]|uniref:uncharacterized protein n=1 Tax=Rutidosis leptorrhynchoides TaxID=125765 RepID=UPI003A995611